MTINSRPDTLVTALSHIAEAGLMLVNPDGSIEFATERAVELMSCGDLGSIAACPTWLRDKLQSCLDQAKQFGTRSLRDEPMERINVVLEDPEQRDVLLEVYPVDIDSCEGILVIVRDETERRQLVRDLLHATRMRNLMRLYRAVSHELRTPVASISIYLHLLRSAVRRHKSASQDPEAMRQIETIAGELGNLDGSMQLLLDELTPSDGSPRAIALRDHVLRAIRLVDIQARQESQSLNVHVSSPQVFVHASGERLRHALLNIAFYRLDAIGAGGTLDLAVNSDDQHAVITVSDHGPRIDHLNRLFTRRHAADDDGTAIGLYVAWEVVRNVGGQLTCASDDEQTRFTIRLPITPDPSMPTPSPAQA